MTSRLHKGATLVILGLAVWLYTPLVTAPKSLYRFYLGIVPRWSSVNAEARTEHGGEAVLPPKVRAILGLLREHRVTEFRYSDRIAKDPDESLQQRLAEGAYPIVLQPDAKHLVQTADEPISAECTARGSREGVTLVRCP